MQFVFLLAFKNFSRHSSDISDMILKKISFHELNKVMELCQTVQKFANSMSR